MAKVTNPLFSSSASGTISGITFGNYRGMAVARVKAQPVRRFRTLQPTNRSIMGYLSRRWGDLISLDRESWRKWAQSHPNSNGFGGTFQQSGSNAFCQLNAVRMMIDPANSENVVPPVTDLRIGMKTLIVATGVNPGDMDLTFTLNGTGSVNDYLDIQAAGPFSSEGVVEVAGKFRRVLAVAGDEPNYTISNLDAGAFYWISVRYVGQDGQVSNPLQGQAKAGS